MEPSFPANWGAEASRKLMRLVEVTLQQAREDPGQWHTPLPQLRGHVRYVVSCPKFHEPHFEIELAPGHHQVTFYHHGGRWHRLSDEASQTLREFWCEPSLSLPAAQTLALDTLRQSEAVRLFDERARAVQPHFALTSGGQPHRPAPPANAAGDGGVELLTTGPGGADALPPPVRLRGGLDAAGAGCRTTGRWASAVASAIRRVVRRLSPSRAVPNSLIAQSASSIVLLLPAGQCVFLLPYHAHAALTQDEGTR
jgi:hypothetical protein